MVGERRAGMGEGRVGLSSPGPLFLSDPHSGSFSMWHLWGHGASLMAPRSHKCASSLRSALSQDGKEKGEDGRGRDGIINKEMKQNKHIIVDWWWENTLTWEEKKTEGWGKKNLIYLRRVYPQVCETCAKLVFTWNDGQARQPIAMGILAWASKGIWERDRGRRGLWKGWKKAPWLPQLSLS